MKIVILSCVVACGGGSSPTPGQPDARPLDAHDQVLTVTTLAGTGATGDGDGPGAMATFSTPAGVAVGGTTVYVAETNGQRIRAISNADVVSTLAGSTMGFMDATGSAAQFAEPSGVAADGHGNTYVADSRNHCIRMITPAGVVTTIAGSPGNPGFVDATGSDAQFNTPDGLAVDSAGTLYVADTVNNAIRTVTSAGVVTTLAGSQNGGFADGTGSAAMFDLPYGTAVDAQGNVYVADATNNRIRMITPAGVVSTVAGSSDNENLDGTGSAAAFSFPIAIAIDTSGALYVASDQQIRKIVDGVVTTIAGTAEPGFKDGPAATAEFSNPSGIAVAADGDVFISDGDNQRIRKLALQ